MLTITEATKLHGEIILPGDKSIAHRGLILGSLAAGKTTLRNFPGSRDCLSTASCLRALGVEVSIKQTGEVIVAGTAEKGLSPPRDVLFAGNSGTTVRLLAGVLSAESFESVIDGDESIRRRPMRRIVEPLTRMGASISARDGEFTPLKIRGGRLKGIDYALPVPSAQVKSSILLAGLRASGPTKVRENIPSRDHTERMLRAMGAGVKVRNGSVVIEGGARLEGIDIDVPGDFSSAAFLIVAALILRNSELVIRGVGLNPSRTGLLAVLKKMGAEIRVEQAGKQKFEPLGNLKVRTSALSGTVVSGDMSTLLIDEIPILALAASQAQGETAIMNAGELRKKETDRISMTVSVLRAFGADIEEFEDGLIVRGPSALNGAMIDAGGDHRIAMMAAIAGLVARGKTQVADDDCINVSFPGFDETLRSLVS